MTMGNYDQLPGGTGQGGVQDSAPSTNTSSQSTDVIMHQSTCYDNHRCVINCLSLVPTDIWLKLPFPPGAPRARRRAVPIGAQIAKH